MSVEVSASILSADFGHLREDVSAVCAAGADWLHIDVMDGHFVPNLSFGSVVVRGLAGLATPMDVHLMVERPEDYVESFAQAGARILTVHAEATHHLERLLRRIREAGMMAGVALNPQTGPEVLEYVLHVTDYVLAMTVNPGFSGQAFLESVVPKIRIIKSMTDRVQHRVRVAVDGGVKPTNAGLAREAGADYLVAASAIFGSRDYAAAIRGLRGEA